MLDSLYATEGTLINWKMMEKVVQCVDDLDTLVVKHDAGEYAIGRKVALIHKLNHTNVTLKCFVSITTLTFYFFMIRNSWLGILTIGDTVIFSTETSMTCCQ